jgi:hypothetical protein
MFYGLLVVGIAGCPGAQAIAGWSCGAALCGAQTTVPLIAKKNVA